MGWGNPIVAGENLVISGIRSQDFKEAETGWRIAKDGKAQFSNLQSLGDFGATGDISADSFHIGEGGLWLPDDTEIGARLNAIDSFPQVGQVWRGAWMGSSGDLNNLTAGAGVSFGILEFDTDFIEKTGWYGFYISPILMQHTSASTNGTMTPRITYTSTSDGVTTPSAPTVGGSVLYYGSYMEANGTGLKSSPIVYHRHMVAGLRYRMLLVVAGGAGLPYGVYSSHALSWVMIYHGNTEGNTNVDGVYGTGVTNYGSTPAPPPAKTYTKTYQPTWSRTYDGDNTTTHDDSASCYQGYVSSARGNTRSLVGYNYTQIQSDLSGATINSIKLTFKVKHAYWNAGVDVLIGKHDYTSKPSTWDGSRVDERQTTKANAVAGSTYTVTLPSGFGTEFKSGVTRGIAFGPAASNSFDFYGYLYGATESGKPYLTITYTK